MELFAEFFILVQKFNSYSIPLSFFALLAVGYFGLPAIFWAAAVSWLLAGLGLPSWVVSGYFLVSLIFVIVPLRRVLISSFLLKTVRSLNLLPSISPTERTALEAGVVWREADLFSGAPKFNKILSEPWPKLTEEEQEYLDGPVEELCQQINDWTLFRNRQIPPEIFAKIRELKLFGIIIPKKYGGLEFSPLLNFKVVEKVASRSVALGVTVMVPNSLGPAELLVHYGTEEQRQKWLPGLAAGTEIPCFGLTEPQAGSDAGAITSEGVLFKDDSGELSIRLNWNKRWITLSAISTVLGLAFRLKDPDNLLGKGEDLGITCALIPASTPGVDNSFRHDPLGVPFHNGPLRGKDVVVKAEEAIIGGLDNAGKGWQMLMESLGAGRGISLPALALAGCKYSTRVSSAHASVRRQFGLPIGKFEGVEEPLSRIFGSAYYLDAMCKYTVSALQQGIKPPIVTAMTKYLSTEILQKGLKDCMDILGGTGISLGPKNPIALFSQSSPISITVEGANILTRTLMVFGQGSLRAHPYAYREVKAIEDNDVKEFDRAIWGHMGHLSRNKVRAILLTLTGGRLARTGGDKHTKRYYQKLTWASASFAFMSDMAMLFFGGKMKVKEKLAGRYADIFSWIYVGTAVLKKYETEGRRKEDLPLVHYSMALALSQIQESFNGIFLNFDVSPKVSWLIKGPTRWLLSINRLSNPPSDQQGHEVCRTVMDNREQRERLTDGIFVPQDADDAWGRYEVAFKAVKEAEAVDRKIRNAIRRKKMPKTKGKKRVEVAFEHKVISQEERDLMFKTEELRWQAIQVDEFSEDEYVRGPAAYKEQSMDSPEQQTTSA